MTCLRSQTGCLDFTNAWQEGDARKAEVLPKLMRALEKTLEGVTSANEQLIGTITQSTNDKTTDVMKTFPLVPSAFEAAIASIQQVVPSNLIEYTPMKEVFDKAVARAESSNTDALKSVENRLDPALSSVRAQFPIDSSAAENELMRVATEVLVGPLFAHFKPKVDEARTKLADENKEAWKQKLQKLYAGDLESLRAQFPIDDASLQKELSKIADTVLVFQPLNAHFQGELTEEKPELADENKAALKVRSQELQAKLSQISLPMNDDDIQKEQQRILKELAPRPGQDALLEAPFKAGQDDANDKNRKAVAKVTAEALDRWARMWSRYVVAHSAVIPAFEVPTFPPFPGKKPEDYPHQILMDKGTALGDRGRKLYACIAKIVEGLADAGQSQVLEFATKQFPVRAPCEISAAPRLFKTCPRDEIGWGGGVALPQTPHPIIFLLCCLCVCAYACVRACQSNDCTRIATYDGY